MGSRRKEFVSFTNTNTNTNPNSDTNTNSDTNAHCDTNAHSNAKPHFVGYGQTNQPINQHDVQRWHKPDSYRIGVKRSSDAAYVQREFKSARHADHYAVQHGLE